MAVRKHIFGSKAERDAWDKLQARWGDRYSLYPNLPFLMVFDTKDLVDASAWPDPMPTLQASEIELNRLKKTSIDFTLCDTEGMPLVCVEFDGMQEDFNVGPKYRAAEPTDPWRDIIMSLKLKVAHGSLFPYFVVGTKEFKDISEATQMCLVDAIIGSVLAGKALRERASHFSPEELGMTSEEFDRLSSSDQHELIQDWFIGVEVEAEVSHNSVLAAEYELSQALRKRLGEVRWTIRYLEHPSLDNGTAPIERAKLMRNAILVGAECTVTTRQFGDITRQVWLPNFNAPGYSEYGFLDELARLLTLDAVWKIADAYT